MGNFGIPDLDDGTVKDMLTTVASTQHRDVVVMQVKNNLLKKDRSDTLRKFPMSHFRKVARVMVGDPSKDFKDAVLKSRLKAKQLKSQAIHEAGKADRKRKKL